MKKILLFFGLLIAATQMACATDDKKSGTEKEINWLTFEQAEAQMKVKPKKVLIDVYTGWCGWCKVMDKKTYTNAALIEYVNENYYAIKFDAEQKAPINFKGKKWEFVAQNKANQLAVELMRGQMSYPTTILMDENFENAQPVPGYMEVFKMEGILKYVGGNNHKKMDWNDWQRSFKAEWK